MKRIILIVIAALLLPAIASARPQYSILQSFGTKCEGCHIAPNNGLQRNMAGWMSYKDKALIQPEDIGLNSVFDAISNTNSILDDKVMFGMDFRYQTARWPKTDNKFVVYDNLFDPTLKDTIHYANPYATKRDYMVMIFTPYVTVYPIEGVTVEASYNLAYDIEDKKRYPGQTPFTANVIYQPAHYLPSLRVGIIQATVGTDWDDHTVMTRQVVTRTATPPSIPCDYFEVGAQLDYQAIDWLGLSLGVFDSKNISEMTNGFVNNKNLSGLAKVTFHPPDFGTGITVFCGATHFFNSRMKTDNGIYFSNHFLTSTSVFLHFGMPGRFAVMTEWMRTELSNTRMTNNYTVELNYQIMEPIIGYLRLERGNTEMMVGAGDMFHGNKYTLGAKISVLPYVALLPEFKIYDRKHVKSYNSQFACQLHIFY